eukprot:Platyproteum_vivax@DN5329_c0_g1_i1.p1
MENVAEHEVLEEEANGELSNALLVKEYQVLIEEMVVELSTSYSSRMVETVPMLVPYRSVSRLLEAFVVDRWMHDFCWSPCFHPQWVADLMYFGFLPMCEKTQKRLTEKNGKRKFKDLFVLMPKLHLHRCVLKMKDLHIGRSTKKRAKSFTITINKNFDGVVEGCHRQHGSNWLHGPIVEVFRMMHGGTNVSMRHDFNFLNAYPFEMQRPSGAEVKLISVEVWHEDAVVAGELGYQVGSCYASLTGFSEMSASGSVQLTTLGCMLEEAGFILWDLGMSMDYKATLGARNVPRKTFLAVLGAARQQTGRVLKCDEPQPCYDILQRHCSKPEEKKQKVSKE